MYLTYSREMHPRHRRALRGPRTRWLLAPGEWSVRARVERFVEPAVLLLLAEGPRHGYELIERLRPFGFEVNDPATVYKSLRQMEAEGLVTSTWELSSRGPARRVYELTAEGRELLGAWVFTLERNREILDHFLARHRRLSALEVVR